MLTTHIRHWYADIAPWIAAPVTAPSPASTRLASHRERPSHLAGVTVSMRVMSASDGYRYLLSSIAAGDGHRSLTEPLTRYYSDKGTPPGFWIGTGTAGLGTDDHRIETGQTVSEDHLRRLLGQGHDPITDTPLGRPYHQQTTTRRTVAGYDFTFSVPKSVSALWAVTDRAAQAAVVRAHHAAIADVIALMEREVAATRVGHNGVAQVATLGLIATAFDHYDSRTGDPQLHTHVVIANKVQGEDGTWRAIDGRPMHAAVVALSEHYNTVLADRLTRDLGLAWEQRDRGADRNPAWEIIGVDDELIRDFSSRSAAIDAEKDRLIADHVAAHGHRPSNTTILRLRQQATLSTRPDKQLHSLAELTSQWRQRASSTLGQDATAWAHRQISTGSRPTIMRAEDVARDELTTIALAVVEQVQRKRATWSRWNLHAEAARQTMAIRFATTSDRDAVVALIADAAETNSLRLSPPELTSTPAAFTRPDGSSTFRPRHSTVYTSTVLLDAEDRMLDLSHATTGPAIDAAIIAGVVATRDTQGRLLSVEQQRVVARIATSGRAVDVLVGPAGTGKTLTLGALRRGWEHEYGPGSVLGLAPSAAAADVLADDLGIDTDNTAKWLFEHGLGAWDFRAGQLVIVDETSLADTMTLDKLTTHAAQVGAKVLLTGDHAQLTSVDAGGAFGMLVRDRRATDPDGAPELVEVRRFSADWEKAASLRLRRGETDVIDNYADHGRIVGGDHDAMLDAAFRAWQSDTEAGKTSLLIAETTDTVVALNNRARTERILAGHVSLNGIELRDGTTAGTGDVIVTRLNQRRLTTGSGWVKNRDLWTVRQVHADGSLTVQRAATTRRGQVVLPADYVSAHVELGYATTAHRAQGLTVDTAHLLVHAATMTREAFYVAMTRGRQANIAYVATDEAHLEQHQHTPGYTEGAVTERTVLYGVLQHDGAQKSAHETITTEQDKWSSIAQLAAEYETIAQVAQGKHFAAIVFRSGLTTERATAVVKSSSFGPLIAQLRRTEADGHQPSQLIRTAVRAGELENANDLAAVLTTRLAKLGAARASRNRPRRPRYIAGFIPGAAGVMPDDLRQTLTELAELIERRASALADQAVAEQQPWTRHLPAPPTSSRQHAVWHRRLCTVAAYRDRYAITGPDPLGPAPASEGQQHDHQRATLAIRRATVAADPALPPPRGPVEQADTGYGLFR